LYYNFYALIVKRRLSILSKTIQVRVDDQLKESSDVLFSSLGLDTSTAIRMFLVASIDVGGIPFAVTRSSDHDSAIYEAIHYRKSGGTFLTAEQSLANMRAALKSGADYGI
jgi:DNA-damage-inducible protein J